MPTGLSRSTGSQTGSQTVTLVPWRTLRASAAGMARMPSTSRRTRTGTSARSRLGFGPDGKRLRRKVSGRTKQEVRDKLKAIHAELDAGLQPSAGFTVQAAVDAWLEHGLSGRSAAHRPALQDGVKPLTEKVGCPAAARSCRQLTSGPRLAELSDQLSTRSLQIAHNCLVRAIRHAEGDDLVGRNVAALVRPPAGNEGRPSKALSVEQAQAGAARSRRGCVPRCGDLPYPLRALRGLAADDRAATRGGPGAALGSRRPGRRDDSGVALGPGRR